MSKQVEHDASDEVGQVEPVEHMSTIQFRGHVVELLGIDPWRLPHGFEAVARLLAIELDRERTRRSGAPWHDLRAGPRRDAARLLPQGVGRLPQ